MFLVPALVGCHCQDDHVGNGDTDKGSRQESPQQALCFATLGSGPSPLSLQPQHIPRNLDLRGKQIKRTDGTELRLMGIWK